MHSPILCFASTLAVPVLWSLHEEQAEVVETGLRVPVDTPLLVSVESKLESELTVLVRDRETEIDVEGHFESRFIDRYDILTDETEKATRRYLFAHREVDGQVRDVPWTGIEVLFERGEDGLAVSCSSGHNLPEGDLNVLYDQADSVWVWLPFPETLAVGETAVIDLSPISSLLLGDEVDGSWVDLTPAELTFAEFDSEKDLATFRGEVSGTLYLENQAGEGEASLSGEIEVVTYLGNTRRLARVELEAEADVQLEMGPGSATGTVEVDTVLETSRPPGFDELLQAEPEYRATVHELPFGVRLDLPSYWGKLGMEDDFFNFYRTLPTEEGFAAISVTYVDDPAQDPKAYLDALETQLEQLHGEVRRKQASCGLGKGASFQFASVQDGETYRFFVDYYPLAGGWILLRLFGQGSVLEEALDEFEAARRTFDVTKR